MSKVEKEILATAMVPGLEASLAAACSMLHRAILLQVSLMGSGPPHAHGALEADWPLHGLSGVNDAIHLIKACNIVPSSCR